MCRSDMKKLIACIILAPVALAALPGLIWLLPVFVFQFIVCWAIYALFGMDLIGCFERKKKE
jgi:hypothetical protein